MEAVLPYKYTLLFKSFEDFFVLFLKEAFFYLIKNTICTIMLCFYFYVF